MKQSKADLLKLSLLPLLSSSVLIIPHTYSSLSQALLDDFDYSDDEEETMEKKIPNQQQDSNPPPPPSGYVHVMYMYICIMLYYFKRLYLSLDHLCLLSAYYTVSKICDLSVFIATIILLCRL